VSYFWFLTFGSSLNRWKARREAAAMG